MWRLKFEDGCSGAVSILITMGRH